MRNRRLLFYSDSPCTEAADKLLHVFPQLLKTKKERTNPVELEASDALLKDRENPSTEEKMVHH